MKLTKSQTTKLRSLIQITVGGHLAAAGYATYAGDEKWYGSVVMPTLRLLGAESAHQMAITCAKYGVMPRAPPPPHASLSTEVWGKSFLSPVGLAAGFDKNAEVVDSMLKVGFGFVEVGSVTPRPQPGNPRPRMFRLTEDRAMINRCGFNSDGHEVVYKRLKARCLTRKGPVIPDDRNMLNENLPSPDRPTVQGVKEPAAGVVGVNLGQNKGSADAEGDYVAGVRLFGDVADYLVINVSSPNTPGLRRLQGAQQLTSLIAKVVDERDKLAVRIPLLVKIAPDLDDQQKKDIAIACRAESGIDGLIVCNTTTSRPATLTSGAKGEVGGLSGAPLRDLSTQTIRDMYRLTEGRVPIVGVGGVWSGGDALKKLRAGASLVQVYTAFGYEGPPLISRINTQLTQLLREQGYATVSEAVGTEFEKT